MAEITYTRQGDYNLLNLLPPQEEPVPHGKYALLRRRFLKEHRRITYTNLLTSGKPVSYTHLDVYKRQGVSAMGAAALGAAAYVSKRRRDKNTAE